MRTRNALTLIELIVVLSILIALSGILLPICSDSLVAATETVTRSSLEETRKALLQYWHDTKLVKLDGVSTVASESQRFELSWLFANPVTNDTTVQFDSNSHIGWNGPYMSGTLSELVDGSNQPLTTQLVNPNAGLKDVRIVSAGPNGIVDIPANTATSALTNASIGDDLYVAIMLR